MTRAKIEPGICGLNTTVEAVSEDGIDVVVKVDSACKFIQNMLADLGDTFDPYEICLCKPGENPFYEYAFEHFPSHGGCAAIAGITKCVEVECDLALPKPVQITFEKE